MNKKISTLLIVVLNILSIEENNASTKLTTVDLHIRSIVLHNGWLYYIGSDGDTVSKDRISDIRSIICLNDHFENIGIDLPENNFRIFPNPVQDILFIESTDKKTIYKIFDCAGRCLLTGEETAVDVSSLKTGIYLMQINNKTLKFIKK